MLELWVAVAMAAGDWGCDYSQEKWSKAGLDAPCKLSLDVASVMKRWSLTEDQARCAMEASSVSRKDEYADANGSYAGWLKCVEQWPQQKALWVGLIESNGGRRPYDELAAKLAPAPTDGGTSLAEELLQLDYAPHALLALHVLKTQPQRLGHFLRKYPEFELAFTTLDLRKGTITPADWEPLGKTLVTTQLQAGHLSFAAELWMQLPPAVRATLKSKPIPEVYSSSGEKGTSRIERGDLRAQLALGLVLAGQKAEAATIPVAEAEPVVKDLGPGT